MWIFANSKRLDYDGFTLYDNRAAFVRPRPPISELNFEALVRESRMRNRERMVECLLQRAEESKTLDGKGRNHGWRETMKLIANYSKAAQQTVTKLK